MNMQLAAGSVHIGLHACQGPDGYLWNGIGRVARDLTVELLNDHRELIGGLHLDGALPAPRTLADFCGDGLLYQHPTNRELNLDFPGGQPPIYHVISPFWPDGPIRNLVPPVFTRAGARIVVTLYDLIPLLYRDIYLAHPASRLWYMTRLKFIQDADLVIVISKATRDDAVRLAGLDPDRIRVVYCGVNDFFRPPTWPREDVLRTIMDRLPAVSGPYLFYPAGTGQYRKNVSRTIEAYALLPLPLRERLQLVISGHMLDDHRAEFLKTARDLGVGDRMVLCGFVDDETLRALYQATDLVLYPSLYEGFGLPIVEAMRCSAPVVTSNCSSMKEILEVEEALFNPEDPSDMSRTIERVVTDDTLRGRLLAYGAERCRDFTWKSAARDTVDAYQQLASRSGARNGTRRSSRKSIAVCTPFPPEKSGIADHNRILLEALCERHPADVHVVVQDDPAGYQPTEHAGLTVVSTRQFRWLAEHGYYDSIIYCMGNSQYHGYIYELLKDFPGTVWMHDIRLTDFYRWYYGEYKRRDIQRLPEELLPWATRYLDHRGDVLLRDNLIQHQQGIYLAGEVASLAERLIVGSRFSRDLITIENSKDLPVAVIPLAAMDGNGGPPREDWRSLARRHGLDERHEPIVSIGILGPSKCPETIIEAISSLSQTRDDLALVFVGPCDEAYGRKLQELVAGLGLRDRVLFTGYVEEPELEAWLASSRCAVQLRFPTNGESSGAVVRALAAGVPTIVNDHGSFRELPEHAVLKVPPQVEPGQLAGAILEVLSSEGTRHRLTDAALRYSKEVSPEAAADRLWSEVVCAP